ncbi:hypothetical protein [Micromonospora sp. NPDC023644]|uniref:hypothetical protein n=1 Tax=Micromonospora sp. NPDC023644 TaxID=3154321 RepID=UPI0033CCB52B
MGRRTALVLVAIATTVLLLLGLGVYVAARVFFKEQSRAVAADVLGDWRGVDDASLTLRHDNTFEARELPVHIQAPDRFSAAWTGSGAWRLSAPDRYRRQYVSVNIDGYSVPVFVDKSDKATRLYLTHNEVGEGRRYWMDRS